MASFGFVFAVCIGLFFLGGGGGLGCLVLWDLGTVQRLLENCFIRGLQGVVR